MFPGKIKDLYHLFLFSEVAEISATSENTSDINP